MTKPATPVPTWLLERLALGELDADTAADVRRRLAAEGRTVDEIAALAVYLASDEAAFTTGSVLIADGGMSN